MSESDIFRFSMFWPFLGVGDRVGDRVGDSFACFFEAIRGGYFQIKGKKVALKIIRGGIFPQSFWFGWGLNWRI